MRDYAMERWVAGQRLRVARLEASVSQEQMAERLGKSQPYVSNLELGARTADAFELRDIAETHYGVSWEKLMAPPTSDEVDAYKARRRRRSKYD